LALCHHRLALAVGDQRAPPGASVRLVGVEIQIGTRGQLADRAFCYRDRRGDQAHGVAVGVGDRRRRGPVAVHVRGDAGDHGSGYLPHQARHVGRYRFLVIGAYPVRLGVAERDGHGRDVRFPASAWTIARPA
jgi:hypothetical protein